MRKQNTIGYILWESAFLVCIATLNSGNRKTGQKGKKNMVQTWIMNKLAPPIECARNGLDYLCCGNCKHRPLNIGSCYVTLLHGPQSIYKAFKRGRYAFLPKKNYKKVFGARHIRFGAYGDPALVPLHIIRALSTACNGFTGYTHQWKHVSKGYAQYLMASVDCVSEYSTAKAKGYRTFRISCTGLDNQQTEVSCPAYTKGLLCSKCNLCCGNSRKAKDISIKVHGNGSKKFIAAAADNFQGFNL